MANFYSKASTDIYLTDDICALNHDFSTNVINTDALVEFCTSGYVSGSSIFLAIFIALSRVIFLSMTKIIKFRLPNILNLIPKIRMITANLIFDKKCVLRRY